MCNCGFHLLFSNDLFQLLSARMFHLCCSGSFVCKSIFKALAGMQYYGDRANLIMETAARKRNSSTDSQVVNYQNWGSFESACGSAYHITNIKSLFWIKITSFIYQKNLRQLVFIFYIQTVKIHVNKGSNRITHTQSKLLRKYRVRRLI